MIFEVTKFSKIQIFRGSAPDPTGETYWKSLQTIDLLAGGEGTRCPSPVTPITVTHVLGPSIRPRFNGSHGLTITELSTVNIILLIPNNTYSYLLVLHFYNPKTFTVFHLVTPSKLGP